MLRPLRDTRSAIVDANGVATVTFGPQRSPWEIRLISVKVSSNTNEPVASIYRGTVNPGTLITATYSGSQDTDSDINDNPLNPGEYYTCQWTNADVGATAIVAFAGWEGTADGV